MSPSDTDSLIDHATRRVITSLSTGDLERPVAEVVARSVIDDIALLGTGRRPGAAFWSTRWDLGEVLYPEQIPPQKPRCDSLGAQLMDLRLAANRLGLCAAVNWIDEQAGWIDGWPPYGGP